MERRFDVVIAGGGPAGLSAAIELGRRGCRVAIVEPVEASDYKGPRTYLINSRSMEHLRRWGIADRLRARNPIDPDMQPDVIFATRLNGHLIHRFERPFVGSKREDTAAENSEWTPQRTIETTLTEYAETLPSITFLWGSRLLSFTDNGDGVTAFIADKDGAETKLESDYLIGADGSHSVVRRALGIRMEGAGTILRAFVHHVRIPELKAISRVGLSSFYWFINGSFDGYSGVIINTVNSNDEYSIGCFPSPPGLDADDNENIRKIICEAIGQETAVEFISGRSYNMHALIAPVMQRGRAFIAGDAAHLLPNLGGFGFNVALLDGADIGWKLAHVLKGWGGPQLLESYTEERHEALTFVANIQIENSKVLSHDIYVPGLEDDNAAGEEKRRIARETVVREKTQEFSSLGTQKGYRLTKSRIVVDDGSPAAPVHAIDYIQTSRPGALAPHGWLAADMSIYDTFGPEYTLLVKGETDDVLAASRRFGGQALPVAVVALPDDASRILYDHRFTLVRPDQMVAWRGDSLPEDLTTIFDTIAGTRVVMAHKQRNSVAEPA